MLLIKKLSHGYLDEEAQPLVSVRADHEEQLLPNCRAAMCGTIETQHATLARATEGTLSKSIEPNATDAGRLAPPVHQGRARHVCLLRVPLHYLLVVV